MKAFLFVMNITYLLGNGFDLQLGLKTTYADFLKEYIKYPSENELIRNFKDFLKTKKSNWSNMFWSDAEEAMGKYLSNFTDDTIDHLKQCIFNFEERFFFYLMREQNKCNYEKRVRYIYRIFANFVTNSFSDVLCNRCKSLGVINDSKTFFDFLTLNYTDTIDHLAHPCTFYIGDDYSDVIPEIYYQFREVHHIHGSLKSQIVMGVDNVSQLDNKKNITLSDDIQTMMIKPNQNKQSGDRRDLRTQQIIKHSDIIVFYGVSFGKTDNTWWQYINDWLKENNNRKIVEFIYAPDTFLSKIISWDEEIFEQKKRKELLNKILIDESDPFYKSCFERTYIILNTKKLDLKKQILFTSNDSSPTKDN